MHDSTLNTCQGCGAPLDPANPQPLCPGCVFAEAMAPAADSPAPGTIGGHLIIEEIARGGMGVVYLAKQADPERLVALKTLRATALGSTEALSRFRQEARAMAALDHPAILPVYQFGEQDGVPYFTMKLATGGTLEKRHPRYHGQWREIAELMATVADAVQHAHAHTLPHRDLKPANILFDEEDRPYVADFGIAKLLDDGDSAGDALTRTSAVLGTPNYLSPEVASKDARNATTASDTWSLGVILYELLAQTRPFDGNFIPEVLTAILTKEPPAIPDAPRDLAVIAFKALSKEPHRRYPTARDMAEDLRRWLEGKPITARATTTIERMNLWARRSPALAGLSALAAVAALTAVGSLVWAYQAGEREVANVRTANTRAETNLAESQKNLSLAEKNKRQAETNLAESQKNLRHSFLSEARLLTRSGHPGQRDQALSLVAQAVDDSNRDEARNIAAAALAKIEIRPASVQPPPSISKGLAVASPFMTSNTAFSEDLTLVARSDPDDLGFIQVLETASGKEICRIPHQYGFGLSLSPNKKRLAWVARQKAPTDLYDSAFLHVWSLSEKPTHVASLPMTDFASSTSYALLRDGGWVCVSPEGAVLHYDKDGKLVREIMPKLSDGPMLLRLAMSRKGDLLVNGLNRSAADKNVFRIIRFSDAKLIREELGTNLISGTFPPLWHPDGKNVFGVSSVVTLELVKVPTKASSLLPSTVSQLPAWLVSMDFDPTGRFLFCVLQNGTLVVLDSTTCEVLQTLPCDVGPITCSSDGKTFAVVSQDTNSVRLNELAESPVWRSYRRAELRRETLSGNLALGPDPRFILAESSGEIVLWDTVTGTELPDRVALSPWSKRLITEPSSGDLIFEKSDPASKRSQTGLGVFRVSYAVTVTDAKVTSAAKEPVLLKEIQRVAGRPVRKHEDQWDKKLYHLDQYMSAKNTAFFNDNNILYGTIPHQSGWLVRNGTKNQWQLWPNGDSSQALDLADTGHWTEETAVSPDGQWFAQSQYLHSPTLTGLLQRGGFETYKNSGLLGLKRVGSTAKPLAISTVPLNQIAFSPDSRWLLGIGHRLYLLFEIKPDGSLEKRLEQPMALSGDPQFAFTTDGKFLALGDDEGQIRFHRLRDLKQVLRFDPPQTLNAGDLLFDAKGEKLFLHSAGCLYELNLAHLRAELAKLGLDWQG